MKISTFNPQIITNNDESVVSLFQDQRRVKFLSCAGKGIFHAP